MRARKERSRPKKSVRFCNVKQLYCNKLAGTFNTTSDIDSDGARSDFWDAVSLSRATSMAQGEKVDVRKSNDCFYGKCFFLLLLLLVQQYIRYPRTQELADWGTEDVPLRNKLGSGPLCADNVGRICHAPELRM